MKKRRSHCIPIHQVISYISVLSHLFTFPKHQAVNKSLNTSQNPLPVKNDFCDKLNVRKINIRSN